MAAKIGAAEYQVGADLKPLAKDLKTAEGMFSRQGGALKKGILAGVGIGGGVLAFNALASGASALIDGISGAIDSAIKFEGELATINTVAKLSKQELAALGEGVQDLSEATGIATSELTSAYYDLVSAGVDAAKAQDVLTDSTTLAIGALSTTGEAVDLITTTLNAFKLEASDSSKVMDVWAQTVANGKVTASELASSIAQVAPIAAAAGVSIEEVAAAYATMTAQGTPAAMAATQMKAAITALLKPNAELLALQEKLNGTTFEQMLREEGLAATLQAVSDAADGKTDAITAALGSTEAYNGMLQVTGANAESFTGNLQDMRKAAREGGNALSMAGERMDTLENKQARLAAKQARLGQDLGAALMPLMELITDVTSGAIDAVRGLVDGINDLADAAAELLDPGGKDIATFAEGLDAGARKSFDDFMEVKRLMGGGLEFLEQRFDHVGVAAVNVEGALRHVATVAQQSNTPIELVADSALMMATRLEEAGFHALSTEDRIATFRAEIGALYEEFGLLNPLIDENTEAVGRQGAAISQADLDIQSWKKNTAEGQEWVREFTEAAVAQFGAIGPAVTASMAASTEAVERSKRNLRRFAREFEEIPESLADSIRGGRQTVRDAMKDLMWAIEHPMQRAKLVASIEGALTGKRLAQALTSKKPDVRAAGEQTRAVLIAEWEKLTGKTWDYGKTVNQNLAKGIREEKGKARAAAAETKVEVGAALKGLPAVGTAAGRGLIGGLASGIRSGIDNVIAAAQAAAQAVADNTKPGSPTKSGPLSKDGGIEAWGFRLGGDLSRGLHRGVDMAGAVEPPTLVSPRRLRAGRLQEAGMAGFAPSAAPVQQRSTSIKMDFHGLPIRVRTPMEAMQQARRAADMGLFG
jgi:TP901 family phage tail tape measure protein